jgi:ribosome assembly protein 4
MSDSVTSATAASTITKVAREKSTLTWGGSLVGSQNPANTLGYRAVKRYRTSEETEGPQHVQIQLQNRQGADLSTVIDISLDSSIDDLSKLVQTLLETNEAVPYSFTTLVKNAEVEIQSTLRDLYTAHSLSTEDVWRLTYQPLSVFRVRPVSRCTHSLTGHTEAVLTVAFSPNGQTLVSGGGDFCVRYWSVDTGLPVSTHPNTHKHHVLSIKWSPDGQRLVSADKSGKWVVWRDSQPVGQAVQGHSSWITDIAWEPLHAIKVAAGAEDDQAYTSERMATSSKDTTIKVWNVRTRQKLGTLSGHTDSVEAIQWGGEGLLYSASRDRTIKVWNVDRYILVRTLTGHGHRINSLALSSAYTLRTGPYDHKGTPHASLKAAWEAAKTKYEAYRQTQGEERLVSGSDDFTLFVWRPESSKHPLKRLTGHQQAVNHLAFSPDGRYFASASFDKKIKLWNGYTGDYMQTLHGHVGAVYQVAWSPDSRYLVTASKDSTAKLWEIPSGKQARETLPGHADEVYALDWSPNGASVATGSKDRTIKLWKH